MLFQLRAARLAHERPHIAVHQHTLTRDEEALRDTVDTVVDGYLAVAVHAINPLRSFLTGELSRQVRLVPDRHADELRVRGLVLRPYLAQDRRFILARDTP